MRAHEQVGIIRRARLERRRLRAPQHTVLSDYQATHDDGSQQGDDADQRDARDQHKNLMVHELCI